MAVEYIEGPADGETTTEWLERMVGKVVAKKIFRCATFEDFCSRYPEARVSLVHRGRVKLVSDLYADGTIAEITPKPTQRSRELIGKALIGLAVQCKDFAEFRRKHPREYADLLRRGFSKNLYQMFEDGTIDSMRDEPPPPPPDRRLKENRVTPLIKRSQVYRQAKLFLTHAKFMRNGGDFAKAAQRLGMEAELQKFFERPLHAAEIFEEAELFPNWWAFETDRPRYADEAVKLKMKDAIVNHIAKAVNAKGGKKK